MEDGRKKTGSTGLSDEQGEGQGDDEDLDEVSSESVESRGTPFVVHQKTKYPQGLSVSPSHINRQHSAMVLG